MKQQTAVEYLKERLYNEINLDNGLKDYYFDMARQYFIMEIKYAYNEGKIYGSQIINHESKLYDGIDYYYETYGQ